MRRIWRQWRPAVAGLLALTVLLGLVYTGVVTGIAQAVFPGRANGGLVTVQLPDGTSRTVGAELIGQEFTAPQYLIGRPHGVTNLSPTSAELAQLVEERVAWWHALDPTDTASIPMDLVTGSGSGVDPHVSPAAAEYQVARIAAARGMTPDAVRAVIARFTTGRLLGVMGEPTVNVLLVNLALDGLI